MGPVPMMEIFDRGVPLRRGQAHVRWIDQLMPIVTDDSDPLGVQQLATYRLPLDDPPRGYRIFRDKADGCINVILKP
jgi:threonine dehydrogenase-like Zn-dependent dehydrogenase